LPLLVDGVKFSMNFENVPRQGVDGTDNEEPYVFVLFDLVLKVRVSTTSSLPEL
jgi:hypothetical protein